MAFEIIPRESSRVRTPQITITNMGRININSGATNLLRKISTGSSVESVFLLWDKDTHQVAIMAAKGDERAYPLKFVGTDRKSCSLSAIPFLNHINYNWSESRSFHTGQIGNMVGFTISDDLLTGKPVDLMAALKSSIERKK